MTFEKLLQKSEEKGYQDILKLMEYMIIAGEADKIPELTKAETYLKEMLKKYNL